MSEELIEAMEIVGECIQLADKILEKSISKMQELEDRIKKLEEMMKNERS